MARLSRKDMQQQTRDRLLAAAQKEIVRKGITQATIRDIAEAAGYSLGAFYSNFESKETILEALVDLHMREEICIFRQIVDEAGMGTGEEMLAKISAWLKTLQKNKSQVDLTFELQMHANRNAQFGKIFNNAKAKRFEELSQGLRTVFARHGLEPKIDFLQMAIAFVALWNGFFIQRSVPGAKPADEMILVFLKALLDNPVTVKAVK